MPRYSLHYTYLFLLLLLIGCTLPMHVDAQSGFSAQLLGTRLLRDADFYGNQDWQNVESLPRQDIGGRLQVSFRNSSAAMVRVNAIVINGKLFEQLSTQPTISPEVSDTKWWRVWPNPVPPGKVATITLRMVNLAADLPSNASFEIRTDQGNLRYVTPQFNPQVSPLRIVSLNFSADLNSTTLFVSNQGTKNIVLKSNSGFSINGGPEFTSDMTVAQSTLIPGDVVPISIRNTASVFRLGEQAFFRLSAQTGEVAIASLRVFPYRFTIQSQMQGSGFDQLDRQRHFVDDWNGVNTLIDEPMSKGIAPLMLAQEQDGWLNAIDQPLDQRAIQAAKRQQQMVEVHNTGYTEGLIYDDIADIASSHWGNTRQDLASYLTAPKPNWYMPQDSWGQNEGLYQQENWYPLEDLQFQAFQAVGRGAKSIQWFLYQNHWEQGWGRRSGTDFARLYQDKFRSGHIGNPLMWDQLGRVSGVLSMLEPYLSNSAYYGSTLTNGISTGTVLSVNGQVPGSYKALVTVMDNRTPRSTHAGFQFRYGTPRYSQQVMYQQPVHVRLPAYVFTAISHAFIVDPWLGVSDLAVRKLSDSQLEMTVPEVKVGALIVLGNANDRVFLQQAWASVRSQFVTYGDGRASLETHAQELPQGVWYEPASSYRQRIDVTNNAAEITAGPTRLKLPLSLALERQFLAADMRVLELHNNTARPVPFFMQGQESYETFTAPITENRFQTDCIGSASPAGCFFRVEQVSNGLNLVSEIRPEGFSWALQIAQAQPWQNSFPDQFIPARFNRVSVEVKQSSIPRNVRSSIVFFFDPDGNPANIKRFSFFLDESADLIEDLGDGWKRYSFDVQRAFNAPNMFPHEVLRGHYSLGFQTQVMPGSTLTGAFPWTIRSIEVSGSDVIVQALTSLAPGETRNYEVYYDVQENGQGVASDQLTTALAEATLESDISTSSHGPELAGVDLTINGPNVAITSQAEATSLIVRHFDIYGTLVAAQTPTLINRSATITLSRAMTAGEMLAIIPVQRGGEGHMFLFNNQGISLSGKVPQAMVLKANWIQQLQDWRADAAQVAPFSLDMSANGQMIAVGLVRVSSQQSTSTGIVRVLDSQGKLLWEKSYPGKVFYVRFAPDGRSLYVAANLSPDGASFEMYTNSHILKYNLSGVEQWRHKVGSSTVIPAAQQGRTVFDMQVYPNGDLIYSEWNTFAVKLNGANGQVLWSDNINFGNAAYIPRVVALQDGGAILVSSSTRCLNANGQIVTSVVVGSETPFAAAATTNCSRWAFAGTHVRVVTKSGDLRIDNPGQVNYAGSGSYVGRSPRTMAFSKDGQYLAAGTSDGIFSLMSTTGTLLWQKRDSSSYVTQIRFLPDNQGVVFAREMFSYRQDAALAEQSSGWRFRDVVEAFDLTGKPLWRHEGQWRTTEPFMAQFALDASGTQLSVMTNMEIRAIDLTKIAVPNDYLYPVEDAPLVEAPIINPGLMKNIFMPLIR